jgi:hypothetical protein
MVDLLVDLLAKVKPAGAQLASAALKIKGG